MPITHLFTVVVSIEQISLPLSRLVAFFIVFKEEVHTREKHQDKQEERKSLYIIK